MVEKAFLNRGNSVGSFRARNRLQILIEANRMRAAGTDRDSYRRYKGQSSHSGSSLHGSTAPTDRGASQVSGPSRQTGREAPFVR